MNLMEHLFVAILGACATVGGGVAAYLFMRPRKAASILDHALAWTELQRICIETVKDSDVQRVMVFMLTNGGGVPRIGSKLYATAIVSVTDQLLAHKQPEYKSLEVDMNYLEMLISAMAAGKYVMMTDAMPRGMLRDIYMNEGVKYAEIIPLLQTQDAFFYMSVASFSDIHLTGAQADIRLAVSAIKQQLQKVFGKGQK